MQVVYSDQCLLHDPPLEWTRGEWKPYVESPARLRAIRDALDSFPVMEPRDHGMEPILSVHGQDYIEFLQTIHRDWVATGWPAHAVLGETFAHPGVVGKLEAGWEKNVEGNPSARLGCFTFDLSVAFMEHTFAAAYMSAQVVLTAADEVWQPEALEKKGAYALCRPPGHHAAGRVAGGYCFVNNVAVATRYLQSKGARRVLIVDVDYHHGNGTQAIFYDDPTVFYLSLHGSPDYPYFTGSAAEQGTGAGKGYNLNVPLNPRTTTDSQYLDALREALQSPQVIAFDAEAIVCSLGLDTWHEDPIAGFDHLHDLDTYHRMGASLRNAPSCRGRPVLIVQEGGYTLDKLGSLVCRFLDGFQSATDAS